MLVKIFFLAAAGALGTLARVGMTTAVAAATGTRFPWATLCVNALGCLLFGYVWALGEGGRALDVEQRALILAGFMGAFTMFSAYGFETLRLAETGSPLGAVAYVALHNTLGVSFVWAGARVGAALHGSA